MVRRNSLIFGGFIAVTQLITACGVGLIGDESDIDRLGGRIADESGDPGAGDALIGPASGDSVAPELVELGSTDCYDGVDNDGDGLVDWQQDLGCYGPADATEGGIATREIDNGWSVFEPSHDTRIIYVSSSAGDDGNAGTSPEQPKKTLAAALAATRDGHPDWVLLARGDTWYENIKMKEGRSRNEPFVVATYGDSTERPLLKTGSSAGVRPPGWHYNNFAVVGVSFYAHTRNPDSDEYTGHDGVEGFNFNSGQGKTGQGILIEDCRFRFYASNVIQGQGVNKDIVLRRNVITDNYFDHGHSQGLYSYNSSILLEENVFDHNGWYRRQVGGGNEKEGGQAVMFNHNTYFTDQNQTTFRGNVFARPSSINNKWTAEHGPASTTDVVIEDNLYIDGDIGITIGGNDKTHPHRFKDITITDNVILHIGRSQPTNREMAWYLNVDDWDGGIVNRNMFLHSAEIGGVRGVALHGYTRNVLFEDNVMHGLHATSELITVDQTSNKQNVAFVVDGTSGDLGWMNTVTNANGSVHPDTSRSIPTYHEAIGKTGTIDAFIAEARQQSKYNWRTSYTAAVVNDWVRAGYAR